MLSYRKVVCLLVGFCLLMLIGPAIGQIDAAPPPPAVDTRAQEPPAPPDEDLPGEAVVDSQFLLKSPGRAMLLSGIGAAWQPQGPSPAYNGQTENIPNLEVVGAAHVVAAHPTISNTLYIGSPNGGIWRTDNATDASPTWTPLTDNMPSLSISALEFDPTDPTFNTLLAGIGRYSSFGKNGGARAGLLHTIDGGATWMPLQGGGVTLVGKNISGVAPRGNTMVVSVDTADSYTCGNIGLFRSTDGGGTFVKVGPPGVAFDLAGDPINQTDLYAGLTFVSSCSGGSLTNGIYKSTDTGANWARVSNPAMDALIIDGTTNNIEIAAHNGNVFANIIQNGVSVGIFYSGNGGLNWAQMDLPLLPATTNPPGTISNVTPGAPIGITTSAAHNLATGDEVQISGVGGTTGANGIHKITVTSSTSFTLDGTNDSTAYTGGGTWEELVGMNPIAKPGGQGSIHSSIRIDPLIPTTVYVGGDRQDDPFPNYIGAFNYTGSLFRGDVTQAPAGTAPSPQWDHLTHSNSVPSILNGGTASSSAPHADSREIAIDAAGNLIETDDGGIYRRIVPQINIGDWISLNGNLQITEMHSIAYDTLSNVIISGNQDTGTTYQLSAGSLIWNSLSTGDGGDVAVDNIALAPGHQSVRYSSYQNFGWFRRSVWDANGNHLGHTYPSLTVIGGGAPLVSQFYTPIATNQGAGDRLLIGGYNSLYESMDGGSTITEIAPGLRVNSGGNTIAYGNMANPDAFYVATGNNVVVRTAPGSITSYALPGPSTVIGVAMDPANWQTAFAIQSNQVYQTTNAGASWTTVTGSMPDTNLRSIAAAQGMVFVGGGTGVYVMDTASGKWYRFGQRMPNAPVWGLDYDDRDQVLVAGTVGRGAWLLSTNMGDIAVSKTPSVNVAVPGETITYTYHITNTGGVTLTVTAVDDKLGPITPGATTLMPHSVTTGTLTYTVTEGDLPGPLTNTVTVSGTYTILGGGIVTDTDNASVLLLAVAVNKTANVNTIPVGKLITYTYRITNTGSATLAVTAVDDKLGPITPGASTLSPQGVTSGVLTYTVTEGDLPGPLTNTATVSGTDTVLGSVVTDTASASVTLTSNPAIEIAKTANVSTAVVSDTITYTYRITNSGNVTLNGITAVDNKLGAVTLVASVLPPQGVTNGVLTYTIIESDLPGPLTNTATVSATASTGAPVSAQTVETVTLTASFFVYLPVVLKDL